MTSQAKILGATAETEKNILRNYLLGGVNSSGDGTITEGMEAKVAIPGNQVEGVKGFENEK